jgi:hypothetical protein
MHLSGLQLRSSYTFLFIIVLCGILWTGYFIGTDRDVFAPFRPLPSGGGGGGGGGSGHYPTAPGQEIGKPPSFPFSHAVDVTVPSGVKIVGLVFFGRRELVKILDCYLKVRPSPAPLWIPLIRSRETLKTTAAFWTK